MKVKAIINDIHIPFHDKAGLCATLMIWEDLHHQGLLDEIILNGDIIDGYGVKLHPKMPHDMNIKVTLKDEIYQANKFLDHLQTRFEGVQITFIEGNHETRVLRYLCAKAPDLFDMFTIPELLKLPERGIGFVPYVKNQRYRLEGTDFVVRHSPYSYAENCAMACLKKKMLNVVFGCTHRHQEVTIKDGEEREKTAISNACMIDFTSPIFNYMSHDNWSQGSTLFYIGTDTYFHKFIKVKNGEAVFNNIHYIGDGDFEF